MIYIDLNQRRVKYNEFIIPNVKSAWNNSFYSDNHLKEILDAL